MRDLRVVGRSGDRRSVLLRSDSGEMFRVLADQRLREALDDTSGVPQQREKTMTSALRPRDIQARIRAGEAPEAVAAAAGLPTERVMSYAVPVLAEREHVGRCAQQATLRRKHSSGPSHMLGDVVDQELRNRGLAPEEAIWDARRCDDGRWAVTVAAAALGVVATYRYDAPGRYVVAVDDEARALVGDLPPADDPTEMAIASAVAEAPFTSVPAPPGGAPDGADDNTAITSIRAARSLRAPLDPATDPDTAPPVLEQPRAVGADHHPEPIGATGSNVGAEPAPPSSRRRRPSVPSWDEIMLGGSNRRT